MKVDLENSTNPTTLDESVFLDIIYKGFVATLLTGSATKYEKTVGRMKSKESRYGCTNEAPSHQENRYSG